MTLQTQVGNERTQVTTLKAQVAKHGRRIQDFNDEQATALTGAQTADTAMTLLRMRLHSSEAT